MSIIVGFLLVLRHYGDAIFPCWDSEVFHLQPSQNFAEGKGAGTPALDDLLPGIRERTYWQLSFYFVVQGVWGKIFGFDLLTARWLSRILGAIGLLLLFGLARQWGLPVGVSILCVLWTALDLAYQYASNFARPDALNAVFLLLALLTFTAGMQKGENHFFVTAGVGATLAMLMHPIAVPVVAVLWATLALRRQFSGLLLFSIPIATGVLAWLAYALQDWSSFVGQMKSQFFYRKDIGLITYMVFLFLGSTSGRALGVFPLNTPLWLIVIVTACVAFGRKHLRVGFWQLMVVIVAYLAISVGALLPYLGWFAPMGFLLTGMLGFAIAQNRKARLVLLGVALIWCGYQAFHVTCAVASVPATSKDIPQFLQGLEVNLPKGATVLLHGVPDPYFYLRRTRPDLHLYELTVNPVQPEAFEKLNRQADFFVGLWAWGERMGILKVEHRSAARHWTIRAPLGSLQVVLVPLRSKGLGKSLSENLP